MATTADAKRFSVTGGGGENHIGNGLALPIQAAVTVGGTVFPTLLIPVAAGAVVSGTVQKPLVFGGGKQGYQRRLVVPSGVLHKSGAQKTVGVHFSNPTVFAVGTNIVYDWPAAPAVFSTGQPLGLMTVAGFGGTMTYTNKLGARFGGAAQYAVSPGAEPAGLITPSIVTVYAKINGTTPPCTHPAFAGTAGKAGCVAGILLAKPTGIAAGGGPTSMTGMTPGLAVIGKNVAILKMVKVPVSGSLAAKALAATAGIPTNMATSQPGPWTTGQIVISNPAAKGGGEKFTIEGKDMRTAGGGGTIQMVSGSVSTRKTSGANANRGWLRLVLAPANPVPSMSWLGLSATAGLLVLTFGYTMRRRIFARE